MVVVNSNSLELGATELVRYDGGNDSTDMEVSVMAPIISSQYLRSSAGNFASAKLFINGQLSKPVGAMHGANDTTKPNQYHRQLQNWIQLQWWR